MTIFNLISLFGGLSLFLYGMRLMGDGLKKGSSSALKAALEKVTNNPIMGFLLGLLVTAVIQSSTATIVLTSGLVGSGLLTLRQSIGVVLGANVGTTVTAQIIRLLDVNAGPASWVNFFKPATLAPLAAILGIFLLMVIKNRRSETGGNIAMGFAILFTGLINMSAAVSPLGESALFTQILEQFSEIPVLGFIAGTAVAFLIQSSSATIGILQAMATTGALTFSSIYAIIIGVNIGDCVTTAIVCSIGSKADAKRTGVIHILFNIAGSLIVILALMAGRQLGALDWLWDKAMSSGDIANVHTLFRLISAVLLLPATRGFERLSYIIVKDDKTAVENVDRELKLLNVKFFDSPSLALSSINTAITTMGRLAREDVTKAMGTLLTFEQGTVDLVNENEDHIDQLADAVDHYMVGLSPHLGSLRADSDLLNFYIQCFSEFERIGDHAVNLTENATELYGHKRTFSHYAQQEILILTEALQEILTYAYSGFKKVDYEAARRVEPVEEVIDELVATLRGNHIKRLREGKCSTYAGLTFLDMLVNVERIADQCSNLGMYILAQQPGNSGLNHHEYTRYLHQGNDTFFNEMFRERYDYYFGLLAQIQEEEAEENRPETVEVEQ